MEKEMRTKTAKARSDTAVQGTNDSSIVSKCSAAAQGYVVDNFVRYMVAKVCRRSPLINRGYCIRMLAMNHVYKTFLENTQSEKQILVIGAGFDAAFFSLNSDGLLENTTYFEVDFPSLMKRKLALIQQTDALNSQLVPSVHPDSSHIVYDGGNYKLLGVDLTDLPLLTKTLQAAGFQRDKPTLVVSEVVLTYIRPKQSSAVIQWAAEHMSNAVFLTYEQINPDDGFGKFMLKHFDDIGSSLKCIHSFSSLQSQVLRYRNLGWSYVEAMDMNYFSHHVLSETERQAMFIREPFDEFEEWNIKCAHYVLLTAFQGSCRHLSGLLWHRDASSTCTVSDFINSDMDFPLGKQMVVDSTCLNFTRAASGPNGTSVMKRFGHSLTRISASEKSSSTDKPTVTHNFILCLGGFGENNSQHIRLKSAVIMDPDAMQVVSVDSEAAHVDAYERMYHTATALHGGQSVLVFGGRRSPLKPCTTSHLLQYTMDGGSVHVRVQDISSDSAPSPRWRHTTSAVASGGREYVIVYGGRTEKDAALDDCHCFDTESFTWSQVDQKGSRPPALHSHTADVWAGSVYIVGGLDSEYLPQSDLYSLSVSEWSWSKVKLNGTLRPRYSHCSCVYSNSLIAVGGVSDQHPPPGVAVINLETRQVQEYIWPLDSWSEVRMMHNIRGVLVGSERLVIVGGGGNCFSFGTHFNSDVTSIDLQKLCCDLDDETGSS